MLRRLLVLTGLLLASGCLYQAQERADQALSGLTTQPYDLLPAKFEENKSANVVLEQTNQSNKNAPAAAGPVDLQTSKAMEQPANSDQTGNQKKKYEIEIPAELPGSEAPLIKLPANDPKARQKILERLYPPLPSLPEAPTAVPGPNGKPYTLADLQQLAALNSPQLRQAAADVAAAQGSLMQARAYPNPTLSYQVQPSSDGSTSGLQGFGVDQLIKMFGKLKSQAAAAAMDLQNAELALRKARSDLSTQVRNAYYGLLVAKETVRVNRALARFTDEIYRIQAEGLLGAGTAAPYEPAALRAQAYSARLAYKQAIQTYIYSWKQLVAVMGMRQLPLTEVAGRIDAAIPLFEFDKVLAHALEHHTDVLTARNGIEKARYNLKFAQITPYPDVDVQTAVLKDFVVEPKQTVITAQIGMQIPIWDQNRGNILSAEAALKRASEEPHRVESTISNNLAIAYAGYKTNLDALESYRRYILPDQVRAYRGVFNHRQLDLGAQFGDLVTSQQTLAGSVGSYLTVLGQLWTSVVSVADFLQTDDLFQNRPMQELPPLPDLEKLAPWPCCHENPGQASGCIDHQDSGKVER